MPIKVTCEKCGGVLHAPDDAGGKKGRCPNCQNILPIPFDASRAPAFGQAPAAPTFGAASAGGPPPGLAFASPAPIGNPLLPNADAKRSAAPPPFGTGSRPETPGMASSTPGLGGNLTFGGQPQSHNPQVQSSMPFGAPRVNASAMQPIAPERNGWASAATGLRWVQTGVVLLALGLIATAGVSIYGATAGQALAEKPGFLKWANLHQLAEIRFLSFAIPAALGALAIVLGRWRFMLVPASSGARGAARWAALFTFVAIVGFLSLVGMSVMAMKDGGAPTLSPQGIVIEPGTPLAKRVTQYIDDVLLPAEQSVGIVQRLGLLVLIAFGKAAEMFFGCSLGRVGANLRDSSAGRVTGTYALFTLAGLAILFGVLTIGIAAPPARTNEWWTKWWELTTATRTMIVAGTAIGVTVISLILYIRMLGSVRRACRLAAV